MGTGMGQLVLFVVSLVDVDKDAEVMLTRRNPDARASELGTNLIEPTSRNSSFRAVYVEGRNWWMVRCLLGQVAYLDHIPVAVSISGRGAVGCSRRRLSGYSWRSILNLPTTLGESIAISGSFEGDSYYRNRLTLKNSPSVELYGLHGFPLMYFYLMLSTIVLYTTPSTGIHTRSLVNQNLNTSSMRPSGSSDLPML